MKTAEPPKYLPVVVLGLCKHGLYLTRNFTSHGLQVYVLERDFKQPSAHTRHGKKIFCADLHGDELVQKLIELKADLPLGTPVFPTNDRMIDVLVRRQEELSDHYRFPFPTGDIVARLKDKERLQMEAEAAGLNVPRSHIVRHGGDLELLRDALSFPVIVKPALPMMSFKGRKCEDLQTLKRQVVASAALGESLIVQDWIEGDDRQILFAGYYIDQEGRCLARYSGRKLLCYPPLTGHAAATEGWDIGHLADEGHSFLRRAGYWGLCSIEYKGPTPGSAKFVEVTVGRCDWWIMTCGINGVNIPMAAYNDLAKSSVPFSNRQQDRFIWHDAQCSLPVLVDHVVSRRWRWRDVSYFLFRPKREALFDREDIKPFLHFLMTIPIGLMRLLGRRAGRLARGRP